ncbi:MAG: hypothetical protein JO369_01365 [Paucibacter sp.]|nr:hypothetical protein [Roseateles sp.]
MADKSLTESEWKKFAKGRDLKDAALLKALAAFEKAREPADQVEALAAIEKEADALRKFVKGDKDFGAQLDAMDKAIAKEEKAAKAAQKEAEAKESEEEDGGSDLLTTKMIPLLRQVKKGDEMHALIAVGTKTAATMLARRPISPSRRKLLTEHLNEGMPKFIVGTCIFELNAYTFVVQSQAAGLAKKLRAALLAQTELRLKVRVRGEDPNDIDDDGEPAGEEHEALEGDGQEALQQATQPTQAGTIPPAPPLPDPLKPQFEKRWAAMEARVLAALKSGTGDVSKIRAVAEFVREKGEGGNYKAALQGMDSLEKLLPAAQTDGATAPTGDDRGAAFNARLAALMVRAKPVIAEGDEIAIETRLHLSEAGVEARKKDFELANAMLDAIEDMLDDLEDPEEPLPELPPPKPGAGSRIAFAQSRLDWDNTRKQVQAELRRVEQAVLAECKTEPDFATIARNIREIYSILEVLDERLIDKLDEAYSADGARRRDLQQEAREIVGEYLDYARSEELLRHIDDNGFVDVAIGAELDRSLKQIDARLREAVAA